MRRLDERGYLVFWRLGVFYCKKIWLEKTFLEQPFCSTRHLLRKRQRKRAGKRERAQFSLPPSLFLFFAIVASWQEREKTLVWENVNDVVLRRLRERETFNWTVGCHARSRARLPQCWSIPAGKSIGYRRLRREGFADSTSRDGRRERERKRTGEREREREALESLSVTRRLRSLICT